MAFLAKCHCCPTTMSIWTTMVLYEWKLIHKGEIFNFPCASSIEYFCKFFLYLSATIITNRLFIQYLDFQWVDRPLGLAEAEDAQVGQLWWRFLSLLGLAVPAVVKVVVVVAVVVVGQGRRVLPGVQVEPTKVGHAVGVLQTQNIHLLNSHFGLLKFNSKKITILKQKIQHIDI